MCNEGALFEVNLNAEDKPSDYYENEWFDQSDVDRAEVGNLERGAPGRYNFEEIGEMMQTVDDEGLIKKRVIRPGTGITISKGYIIFSLHYTIKY